MKFKEYRRLRRQRRWPVNTYLRFYRILVRAGVPPKRADTVAWNVMLELWLIIRELKG